MTIICLLTTLPAIAEDRQQLSLDEYLSQVRARNEGVRSAIEGSRGAFERKEEGSLLFSPSAFANASVYSDQQQKTSTAMGTQTDSNSLSSGISKITRWGLQSRLYYNISDVSILGANPAFVTVPNYFSNTLNLEISQPLWQNGFGRSYRAQEEAQNSQALAEAYNYQYAAKQSLAAAEQAYWQLALARETLDSRRQLLKNAEELKNWSARRVELRLADRADLLQATALFQARELELKTAEDTLKTASRSFNTTRGVSNDEVLENVAALDAEVIDRLEIPARLPMREDVKAAAEQAEAAVAASRIAEEQTKPTLNAFANVSLTGLDGNSGTAFSTSLGTTHPVRTVGLQFNLPLDIGRRSRIRSGHQAQVDSAHLRYQRTLFEQERQWNELVQSFNEVKEELVLARKFEAAQKEKLTYEKERQKLGRTTTYQVILFEQDYGTAQLSRILLQGKVLALNAQIKTFAENKELGGNP